MADLAFVLQQFQLADLIGQRHLRVDPVQLVERDALEAEVAQAQLGLLAQVLGTADRSPVAGTRPGEPGLGRDDEIVGVRVQRLLDQFFGDERPVRVGRIDEVDAEFYGAL